MCSLGLLRNPRIVMTEGFMCPVGFRSSRVFWSYMRFGELTMYHNNVRNNPGGRHTVFTVQAQDDTAGNPIVASSASECWNKVFELVDRLNRMAALLGTKQPRTHSFLSTLLCILMPHTRYLVTRCRDASRR